jgi:exonuclease V gamma subunit
MPLTSYHVTRMTEMGDILANQIKGSKRPADKIFCKEIILVDGKALSNWLSYYLVRDAVIESKPTGLGVHAHADLMNTHRFAPWAAAILRGEEPGSSFQDPLGSLELRVHAILSDPKSKTGKAFKDVVGQPKLDGGMVRWEVSQRIAARLRELTLDDPEWTQQAQLGTKSDRLGALWKQIHISITKENGGLPVSAVDIMERLEKSDTDRELIKSQLPGRITLLASGDIPRTLLRSIAALGKTQNFEAKGIFLQPTLGYYLDIRDGIELPKDLDTPGADFIRQTAKHFHSQFKKLVDAGEWNFGGDESDNKAFPATLLGSLQQSIEHFDEKIRFDTSRDPENATVTIHRCHSVVREIEVLRDELIKAMQADKTLNPRDILILSPDPETYASVLQGIFRDRGEPRIYVTNVALEGTGKSALTSLAEALLSIAAGRCTAQEVIDLIELKVILDRYRWDTEDVATIKKWFKAAPFFWGVDAAHRERLTEVSYGAWSLVDFRNRLILGTALAPDNMLAGSPPTLTLGDIEGKQSAQLAAELIEFTDLLRKWIHEAGEPHSLKEWTAIFAETLKGLMPDTSFYAEQAAKMERALGSLSELAKQATEDPIGLNLFTTFATPVLDVDHGKGQFMSGGAVLAPLRSSSIHPAKVIALLGMKDGSFPVRGKSPGPELNTDLPLQARQFKEQSEQRGMHAILLAIGAAQNRLIVTFPGYAGDTGKPANAALPVELIKQACHRILKQQPGHPGFKIRRHGIHAHEAAIGDKKETSETHTYDGQAVAAAQTLGQEPGEEERVINPARPFASWSMDEWVEFWKNPAEGLFKSLDLKTVWLEDELPADEALQPPLTEGKMTSEQRTTMYKAIRWAKNYQSRTSDNKKGESIDPDLVAAKLSGHFSEQATEEHLEAILAKTQSGGMNAWVKTIERYFNAKPQPLTNLLPSYHSAEFPSAYHIGDWLIFSLPDEVKVEDKHLLPALAALAEMQTQGVALTNVAIFGKAKNEKDTGESEETESDETTDQGEDGAALGVRTNSTKDNQTLFRALENLAKRASGTDFFLGENISIACSKHAMPKEVVTKAANAKPKKKSAETKGQKAPSRYESQIYGSPPYSKGDIHDNHGRLLSPARYNPEKVLALFQEALIGCTFLPDKTLEKYLKTHGKK